MTKSKTVMEVESAVSGASGVAGGMRSALEVVQERAREQRLARALAEGECEASDSSDSEAVLAGALAELPPPARAAPPPPPAAAALLPRLAAALAALPTAHPTAFLRDLQRAIVENDRHQLCTLIDEMMQYVERAAGGAVAWRGADGAERGDGVVLAACLALAAVWRAPRLPAAPRALHALAPRLTHAQVEEVARALHASLPATGELLLLSDVLRAPAGARGAEGGAPLAELLLRAALADILALPQEEAWRGGGGGALSVEETTEVLGARWARLGAPQQLQAARLAGRVLAAAATAARGSTQGGAAARLLDALPHPPPPLLRHDPDYIKVDITLTKLRMLFNAHEKRQKIGKKKHFK